MRLATLMGAIKAEVDTPQGYCVTPKDVCARYESLWHETLALCD
jgi:hypothetical protein